MQRKSTEYLTGWQSAIAYLDEDLEREKREQRVQEAIALRQRPRQTVPFNKARLWQWGLLIFIAATVLLITLVRL